MTLKVVLYIYIYILYESKMCRVLTWFIVFLGDCLIPLTSLFYRPLIICSGCGKSSKSLRF